MTVDAISCSLIIFQIESQNFKIKSQITAERLRHLDMPSFELQHLHADLFYCYKVVFGYTDLKASDFFEMAPCPVRAPGP